MELISIITPAYRAQHFLNRCVRSVLQQSYARWEMIIVADDGFDYYSLLKGQGIKDSRIKFISTGKKASGASHARNVGMNNASGNIIAILDADDAFAPQKLEICAPKVSEFSLVSCALSVCTESRNFLRGVGTHVEEGIVKSSAYKKVNFSMDSMILFDRRRLPVSYDEKLLCQNDIELIINCFEYTESVYHFPQMLHQYIKQPNSLSNSQNSNSIYTKTKMMILERLKQERYNFVDKKVNNTISSFLKTSLKAEKQFEDLLKRGKQVIFEDVMESLLPEII